MSLVKFGSFLHIWGALSANVAMSSNAFCRAVSPRSLSWITEMLNCTRLLKSGLNIFGATSARSMSEMSAFVRSSASPESLIGGRMFNIAGMSEKYLLCDFFVMERKKDAKASTEAIRTCQGQLTDDCMCKLTHRSLAVCKTALEGVHDHIFMLLFDNLRRRGEYPKRVLTLGWILRLTGLEQCAQKLRPCHTYTI